MISPNEKFENWANSYSGCDGGNIRGSIWFCGIEFGGGDTQEQLKKLLDEGPADSPPFLEDDYRGEFMTYQYNWRTLKLYSSILGIGPKKYRETFENTKAFSSSSDVFKMNLYPIAFHGDRGELWEKWHYDMTGFPSKQLYQSWCQLNRFASIKSWVNTHSPKAVIGTGSSYRGAFLMAFSSLGSVFREMSQKEIAGCPLCWSPINDDKTMLFVTPFLGQGGLKSDKQIELFGREIDTICTAHFGREWRQHYSESSDSR